jgi:hypothetical protein
MLSTHPAVLNILTSRVREAQSRLTRCCIAFANMCCATSRTDDGRCEFECDGNSENSALSTKPAYEPAHGADTNERMKTESVAAFSLFPDSDMKESAVFEVIGMDCPDCVSKVTRAVDILSGAEVANADGVRGLLNVRYDASEY